MTILVATLQRENAELRMAAMSGQPPPPPATTSTVPASGLEPRHPPPNEDPSSRQGQGQDPEMDRGQLSPSRNKRPARPRNSS